MSEFYLGATVTCWCNSKDADGAYTDPTTLMNIVINRKSPNYEADIVSSTVMTKDSTGKYHYDFATTGKRVGNYEVVYTAIDGSRITIEKDEFRLT